MKSVGDVTKVLLVFLFSLWFCGAVQASEEPDFSGFSAWLEDIRLQALGRGYSASVVDAAFNDLEPDARVIGFDRRQPEFVQTFDDYLRQRVSEDRIIRAREFFITERDALQKIGNHYGVDPEYIVAFWGLESSFGRYQGKYSVIRSVATLAYDARRSAFFTRQLFAALTILEEGHVNREDFVGGWAGAMGQNQFIPTSFLKFAQDFDGDGRKNIWSSREDVWASIAFYLQQNQWQAGAGWGQQVRIPADLNIEDLRLTAPPAGCRAYRHHTVARTPVDWAKSGIDAESLDVNGSYALLIPDAGLTESYLVGGNFGSILSYNCANKYAVSVGLLADQIVRRSHDQEK